MRLTPHEQDRLMLYVAAEVAVARRDRGLRLNHPEAVAVLSAWVPTHPPNRQMRPAIR